MLKKLAKVVFLCLAPALLLGLGLIFFLSDLWTLLTRHFGAVTRTPQNKRSAGQPYVAPRGASVVIPNWNGMDLLEKFLPSVLAAAGPLDEIIVVDNASTDGSAAFVRRRFPRVRVLELPRNLGF